MYARWFHGSTPLWNVLVLTAVICCWHAGLTDAVAVEKVTLQDFLVRSWQREDGLPAADVRAIARTLDGYLWIGTTRGLVRFDGVRFVTLTTNDVPSLGDNRITCLLVTRSGELWVGTESGFLARRNGETFEPIALAVALQGKRLNSLIEDHAGDVWSAVPGLGMARWRQGFWDVYTRSNGLPVDGALQVVADKQGQIQAISSGRLVEFKEGRWQLAPALASVRGQCLALAPARDGGIWVATASAAGEEMGSRVFKIKDGVAQETGPYPWPQNTFHTRPQVLFEDSVGRLWAGLATAGIYYLEPGDQWRPLVPAASFSQILVNCLAEDDAGNLWVGLNGAQLDQVRPRTIRTLHLPGAASQNVVRMCCARRDGSIWVGTDGAGVFRYQNGSWTRFGVDEGLRNQFIGVIFEDSASKLWVGTWNGLYLLDGERFVPAWAPTASQVIVRAVCEDRLHNLWFGTSVGVIRQSGKQAQALPGDEGYLGAQVVAITEDATGAIWAALSGRGLYRLSGERFERYSADPWSGQGEIGSLLADAEGGLWVGTLDRGFGCIKDGRSMAWATQDGLPSDYITAMMEDGAGNLWCGSDNGIFGLSKSRLLSYERGVTPPVVCWQLSVADGLDSRRCSGNGQPVATRGADGRLWFPNSHALAAFDPAGLLPPGLRLSPLVEEVIVDGERRMPAHGAVQVSSATRSYEIHYTSPTLQVPERLRFRFRLSGFEPAWVEAGQRRVAYYSHLPPRNYTFEVMASGPDGAWHESAETLHLEVVPTLWQRRWVRGLAGLSALAICAAVVWSVARVRLRQRLALVERQRALETERSRIARDMHDELGARLTQITLLSAMTSSNHQDAEQVRVNAEKVADVSRELTRTLDEMVWAVRPQNDNLENVVEYLRQMTGDVCDGTKVQCWFSVPKDVPSVEVQANVRHNLLLACREAVTNVLKHSGATELRMEIGLEPNQLEVDISDNGCGFKEAEADPNRSGLRNMRQRMAEVGGTCTWQNIAGGGTRVRFQMPLPKGSLPVLGGSLRTQMT
jgi:ligand-binding sensor domain-containing protein/signal transduction histidine kinase